MSRDREEEKFSIDINTRIYEDYDMPYFELKIVSIHTDSENIENIELINNWNNCYDLDDIHTMNHNLDNFEIYFDDIDIDKLVYIETYYCIPNDCSTFVERIYQSPKYTEEQINSMEQDPLD